MQEKLESGRAQPESGSLLVHLRSGAAGFKGPAPTCADRYRHAAGSANFTYRPAPDWVVKKFIADQNIYFVENKRELLDAPTEWYWDSTTRRLYFSPATSAILDTIADGDGAIDDAHMLVSAAFPTGGVGFGFFGFLWSQSSEFCLLFLPCGRLHLDQDDPNLKVEEPA